MLHHFKSPLLKPSRLYPGQQTFRRIGSGSFFFKATSSISPAKFDTRFTFTISQTYFLGLFVILFSAHCQYFVLQEAWQRVLSHALKLASDSHKMACQLLLLSWLMTVNLRASNAIKRNVGVWIPLPERSLLMELLLMMQSAQVGEDWYKWIAYQ